MVNGGGGSKTIDKVATCIWAKNEQRARMVIYPHQMSTSEDASTKRGAVGRPRNVAPNPKGTLLEVEAHYRQVMQKTEDEREKARKRRRAAINRELGAGRTFREIAEDLNLNHSGLVRFLR